MRVRMQQWLLVVASVTLGVVLAAVLVRYRAYRLVVTNRWSRWTSNVRPHADIYKHWLEGKGIHFYNKEEQPKPSSDSVVDEAAYLLKTSRVLCYVMLDSDMSVRKFTTSFYNVDGAYATPPYSTPDEAISNTWGKRCSKLIFFSSNNAQFSMPTVKLKTQSSLNSWSAHREAILYISKNFIDDFSWFVGVEEDTFILMENLAYFVSVYNSTLPWYFGHAYTGWGYSYNVAGAGAVLSHGALRRLSNKLALGHCSEASDRGDQSMARCLSEIGIVAQDTRDHIGRATFLPFRPESHLVPGRIPWTEEYWTKSSFLSPEVCRPAF